MSFSAPAAESYSTSNIKLAAMLYVLGFPLAPGMPATREVKQHQTSEQHQWWFERSHQWGENPLTGPLVEHWYAEKDGFAAEHPQHPITWMRDALDARGWLYRVKYGSARLDPVTSGPLVIWKTDDVQFASCLVTARYRCLKWNDRQWEFWDDGQIKSLSAQFHAPFDEENPLVHLPVTWRREVLKARDHMHKLMTDPRCVPMVHMRHKGRPVILSAYADREIKFDLFSK